MDYGFFIGTKQQFSQRVRNIITLNLMLHQFYGETRIVAHTKLLTAVTIPKQLDF